MPALSAKQNPFRSTDRHVDGEDDHQGADDGRFDHGGEGKGTREVVRDPQGRVPKDSRVAQSANQGTIVEWTVAVGEAVKADDVVALVETDKVTVDIKAEVDGVVVEQFGAM